MILLGRQQTFLSVAQQRWTAECAKVFGNFFHAPHCHHSSPFHLPEASQRMRHKGLSMGSRQACKLLRNFSLGVFKFHFFSLAAQPSETEDDDTIKCGKILSTCNGHEQDPPTHELQMHPWDSSFRHSHYGLVPLLLPTACRLLMAAYIYIVKTRPEPPVPVYYPIPAFSTCVCYIF